MLTLCLVACVALVADELIAKEAARIREAFRLSGITLEKAAVYMGTDKGLLSRQLAGDGHLSHSKMLLLPPEWWQWYHVIGVQDVGLPPRLANMPRMAKMTLPTAAVERERA